jgi:hypothetical protein
MNIGGPSVTTETKIASKTVTFTGASGLGLHATATTCFTIAGGLVVIDEITGRVTTNCTGATATVTLGVTGSTSLFIGTTTATDLVTTTPVWATTTPTAGGIALAAADKGIVIAGNVLLSSTHASADVASGVVEINVRWHALTPGATLS